MVLDPPSLLARGPGEEGGEGRGKEGEGGGRDERASGVRF